MSSGICKHVPCSKVAPAPNTPPNPYGKQRYMTQCGRFVGPAAVGEVDGTGADCEDCRRLLVAASLRAFGVDDGGFGPRCVQCDAMLSQETILERRIHCHPCAIADRNAP